MIPVQVKIHWLIVFISAFIVAGFAVIFYLAAGDILVLLGLSLTLIIASYLAWLYINNIGWRQKFFRMGGWLTSIPDLRGRWIGELDRKDAIGAHRFVIEIQQTLTSIQVHTFSARGQSSSFTAQIICDSQENHFQLVYTWIGKGGVLQGEQHEVGFFYGTTILDFIESPTKRLKGEYYTNRSPIQTKGRIEVVWQGYKALNAF
jgi:hypothetical protein